MREAVGCTENEIGLCASLLLAMKRDRETRGGWRDCSVCGICIVCRWEARGPYESMGSCNSVTRTTQLPERVICTDIALLFALERRGVTKSGMSDIFVFFEIFYLSVAGEKKKLIGRLFFHSQVEPLCHFRVSMAKARHYSFYGGSVVARYTAAGDVEQLFEQP